MGWPYTLTHIYASAAFPIQLISTCCLFRFCTSSVQESDGTIARTRLSYHGLFMPSLGNTMTYSFSCLGFFIAWAFERPAHDFRTIRLIRCTRSLIRLMLASSFMPWVLSSDMRILCDRLLLLRWPCRLTVRIRLGILAPVSPRFFRPSSSASIVPATRTPGRNVDLKADALGCD